MPWIIQTPMSQLSLASANLTVEMMNVDKGKGMEEVIEVVDKKNESED